MRRFLKDFFMFPFQKDTSNNRFGEVMHFIVKEYPAFFREKPTIARFIAFPFLLITVMCRGASRTHKE